MHPKIEAIFSEPSKEEIWEKIRNENWYCWDGLLSIEWEIDKLEFRQPSTASQRSMSKAFDVLIYTENFIVLQSRYDTWETAFWNPSIYQ